MTAGIGAACGPVNRGLNAVVEIVGTGPAPMHFQRVDEGVDVLVDVEEKKLGKREIRGIETGVKNVIEKVYVEVFGLVPAAFDILRRTRVLLEKDQLELLF